MESKVYDISELKEKKLLSKDEAAFYIGICVKTLNNILDKNDFPAKVRIGFGRGRVFINREKLDNWIDEQTGR
jgi:predicted DNA-binding transcriptional regulator AlpA